MHGEAKKEKTKKQKTSRSFNRMCMSPEKQNIASLICFVLNLSVYHPLHSKSPSIDLSILLVTKSKYRCNLHLFRK